MKPRAVDRYGRTVSEVGLPDGLDLGRELVGAGLAWHYIKYAPTDATLRQLQAEAKAERRGLWAEAGAVPLWDWRAVKGRGEALPAGSVVGNRQSKLYHSPTYRGGAKIVEGNQVAFSGAEAAAAAGYRRVGDCR